MRVLLDTHVMLALIRGDLGKRYPAIASLLAAPRSSAHVSAASLWEMAIKTRLNKLDPGMQLEYVVGFLARFRLSSRANILSFRNAICDS